MLDFSQDTLFVEVILPLSLGKNYTYRVPQVLNEHVQAGKRVLVQFGKSRIYTALIYKVTHQAPELYQAKYLLDVVDEYPIISWEQIKFWEWISQYYLCNLGDVMSVAIPSAFKWSSDTVLHLAEHSEDDISNLSADTQMVYLVLIQKKRIEITEIMDLLQRKNIQSVVNSLVSEGFAYLAEEITDKFKPRKKSFVTLHPDFRDENRRRTLFQSLERAPKQLDILLQYLQLSVTRGSELPKDELLASPKLSAVALKALADKGVFQITQKVVSRLDHKYIDFDLHFKLSPAQEKARYEIEDAWHQGTQTVLLHGVTSSGKTQVYIKIIEEELRKNPSAQILFLLPEIALTTQLVERVRQYFLGKIGVYHSKFSDQERVEIWRKVMSNDYQVVLGARSAVFLPFQNLKMVIVDEEHESSFKQQEPAPRYQARDAAIVLATQARAKVLLGSATPSLESWYNAQQGKYALVSLSERFGGVSLPEIEIIDLRSAHMNTQVPNGYFSQTLVQQIADRIALGEQVILFQNRRGFSLISFCKTCGFTPKCTDCDVSLTFHKSTGKLHCHYCGASRAVVHVCPACGSAQVLQKGVGTEKVEEDLKVLFPNAVVARLDIDSTRKKNSVQLLLDDFKAGKIQILVGTQMVAKGLDFDNVTLIGIINADSILNYPDFRAYERAYQLMAQVSGRAGRRHKQGKVCIQTLKPKHPIIQNLLTNAYEVMAQEELKERVTFKYPPYCRLIVIRIKHKEEEEVILAATYFAQILRAQLAQMVLGPEAPLVAKVRNWYLRDITLKIELDTPISPIKKYLRDCVQYFYEQKKFKNVLVQIDVDTY